MKARPPAAQVSILYFQGSDLSEKTNEAQMSVIDERDISGGVGKRDTLNLVSIILDWVLYSSLFKFSQ